MEIERLLALGMTTSDLRWLVKRGYLSHSREITLSEDAERRFEAPNIILRLPKRPALSSPQRDWRLAMRALILPRCRRADIAGRVVGRQLWSCRCVRGQSTTIGRRPFPTGIGKLAHSCWGST